MLYSKHHSHLNIILFLNQIIYIKTKNKIMKPN